jgi:hypothetical protein
MEKPVEVEFNGEMYLLEWGTESAFISRMDFDGPRYFFVTYIKNDKIRFMSDSDHFYAETYAEGVARVLEQKEDFLCSSSVQSISAKEYFERFGS